MVSAQYNKVKLSIANLDLYTHCPMLYRYHPSTQLRDSFDLLLEKAATWLFTYQIRTGHTPKTKQLDEMWSRIVPHNIDTEHVTNSWIILRKIMSSMLHTHLPQRTNIAVRHIYKNVELIGYIPLLYTENDKLKIGMFSTLPKTRYMNDLAIRYCAYKTRHILDIEYINIFGIRPNNNAKLVHSIVNPSKTMDVRFTDTLEKLMDAAANGPHNPRYMCTFKSCIHWKHCTL